jgi:hypothetical protein
MVYQPNINVFTFIVALYCIHCLTLQSFLAEHGQLKQF